jgi:hypothetical protein
VWYLYLWWTEGGRALGVSSVFDYMSVSTDSSAPVHAPIFFPKRRHPLSYLANLELYLERPLATVTVEDAKEPGEWMAHGVKGARRLFVCKVLFEVERDVFKI